VVKEDRVVEPLEATVKRLTPVEEATVKTLAVEPPVPCTDNRETGALEPIPTLPPLKIAA
jgi:hypothetical protein